MEIILLNTCQNFKRFSHPFAITSRCGTVESKRDRVMSSSIHRSRVIIRQRNLIGSAASNSAEFHNSTSIDLPSRCATLWCYPAGDTNYFSVSRATFFLLFLLSLWLNATVSHAFFFTTAQPFIRKIHVRQFNLDVTFNTFLTSQWAAVDNYEYIAKFYPSNVMNYYNIDIYL